MSTQTPAGGSEPSVALPPAGLPTEEHWRLAADAVTGHLLEVDQVRAVAEAIAAAEHRSRLPIDVDLAERLADDAIRLFLDYRAAHPEWSEDFTRNAAAGDAADGASTDLPTHHGRTDA